MIRRRLAVLLLLAGAAPILGGCAFARRAMPMDASGMDFPVSVLGNQFDDQVRRTGDTLTRWPAALSRHTDRSLDRLFHGPETLESKVIREPTATGGVAYR